jgi:hypothetical protein
MDDYVSKPVNIQALYAAIARCVEGFDAPEIPPMPSADRNASPSSGSAGRDTANHSIVRDGTRG